MENALALTKTPSLLVEAMRRRVSARRRKGGRGPPALRRNADNNYVAEANPQRAETLGLPRRSGAKPGNRNAVRPERAEMRALLAEVKAHIARMKAAIARAEAVIVERKRRRIAAHVLDVDGTIRRVWTVERIKPRAKPTRSRGDAERDFPLCVIPDAPAKPVQFGTRARSGTHCEIGIVSERIPDLRTRRCAASPSSGMTALSPRLRVSACRYVQPHGAAVPYCYSLLPEHPRENRVDILQMEAEVEQRF
jgi:hypothetical protein